MRNIDKYKTAQERADAFMKLCNEPPGSFYRGVHSVLAWLELEAEEENPLPCPFCGGECIKETKCMKGYRVFCEHESCSYVSSWKKTIGDSIAAHNRVAKKCMEVKE